MKNNPEEEIAKGLGESILDSAKSCWVFPSLFESKEIQEEHLLWMVDQIREGKITGKKAHRWIGFIQGVLVSRGVTSVEKEAARVRRILGKEWLESLDGENNKKLTDLDPKTYY